MKKSVFAAITLLCFILMSFAAEGNEMSQDDMMKQWMEMASPGPNHEMLAKRAGEWNTTIKYWMSPGADPMVSTGTRSYEVLNGGRIISEASQSEMMGMSYEAHGMTGYDNAKKKFWSAWSDNMSTSVLFMEGVSDDGGKTISYNTSENNPMTGEDEPVRFVFRWADNDTHILESWHGAGTPNEFKVMEITCTRKK